MMNKDMRKQIVDDSECESDIYPTYTHFPQLFFVNSENSAKQNDSILTLGNSVYVDSFDEDDELDDGQIIREVNNSKLYVRKVIKSSTTKGGKKKKTKGFTIAIIFVHIARKCFLTFLSICRENTRFLFA